MVKNEIIVIGKISSCEISHTYEYRQQGRMRSIVYYLVFIDVQRDSGVNDSVPVLIQDYRLKKVNHEIGDFLAISGTIGSRHLKGIDGKTHLVPYCHASIVEQGDTDEYDNIVTLTGTLYKDPLFRTVPSGRKVTNLFLKVKQPNSSKKGPSSIPCIAWGPNAIYADNTYRTGDTITINGRFQSRAYKKRGKEDALIYGTAYEISITDFEEGSGSDE